MTWCKRWERELSFQRDMTALWRERAMQADQRVLDADTRRDHAIKQVQDLAQQLATIRINHPTAVPDDKSFEVAVAPPPYSQQLQAFLDGLLSDEARMYVEEQVERMRERGIDDEQIYNTIDDGEET